MVSPTNEFQCGKGLKQETSLSELKMKMLSIGEDLRSEIGARSMPKNFTMSLFNSSFRYSNIYAHSLNRSVLNCSNGIEDVPKEQIFMGSTADSQVITSCFTGGMLGSINWCEFKEWLATQLVLQIVKRLSVLSKKESNTVGSTLGDISYYKHTLPAKTHAKRRSKTNSNCELTTLMQKNVSLTPMQDRWTWTLNASGDFSVASVRNLIDTTMLLKGEYQTKWIRVVPIKVNTCAWKVMMNSLPLRFNISRRGIDIDIISCGNCDLCVETSNHLFFNCDMAKQITRLIMRWWDVPELEIDSYNDWRNWIVNVRMPSKNKDMFDGVFYVMWWTLWIFRNNKIFGDKIPSKAMLFDDVICKSFHLCRARSKMLFSWND
ncbi:RNA-directed DNA polymerase, eukaryota [Tanacetum coccineum]